MTIGEYVRLDAQIVIFEGGAAGLPRSDNRQYHQTDGGKIERN